MRGLAALCLGLALVPSAGVAQTSAEGALEGEPRTGGVVFPDGYVLGPLATGSAPTELGGGAPLTLAEVLSSVEAHHPPLEALEARVAAAAGNVLAADGAFDPTLSARLSVAALGYYEYGRMDATLTQATPLYGTSFFAGWRWGRPLGPDDNFPDYYGEDRTLDGGELRAGLTVPLLRDGWTDPRRAGIARAGLAEDAARAELLARQLRVRLSATETYLRWVAAGQKLQIAQAVLELAEARDEQLRARAAGGAIAPIEHLENRRAVLERRQAIVTAARALERAAIALSLFYRDESGAPLVVPPTRHPGVAEIAPLDLDEERAVALALERRPELTRIGALIESADVARDLAENQILPRLDATLAGSIDVGSSGETSDTSTLSAPVLSGSLVLTFPLFLREGLGRRDAARGELAAITAEAELAGDQIAIEVHDAYSALRAATEAVALADESRRIAEAVAAAERARFEAGASSLLLVNLREAMAAQAASSFVDADVELQLARALSRAVTASEPM